METPSRITAFWHKLKFLCFCASVRHIVDLWLTSYLRCSTRIKQGHSTIIRSLLWWSWSPRSPCQTVLSKWTEVFCPHPTNLIFVSHLFFHCSELRVRLCVQHFFGRARRYRVCISHWRQQRYQKQGDPPARQEHQSTPFCCNCFSGTFGLIHLICSKSTSSSSSFNPDIHLA